MKKLQVGISGRIVDDGGMRPKIIIIGSDKSESNIEVETLVVRHEKKKSKILTIFIFFSIFSRL